MINALKGPLELIAIVATVLLWPPRTYLGIFPMRGKAKPGDVIRLLKLRANLSTTPPGGYATAKTPAWFYVTGTFHDDEQLAVRVLKITDDRITDVDLTDPGEEWSIANSHKTRRQFGDSRYQIIRPERWPDDISAAVMVLKLQGVIE